MSERIGPAQAGRVELVSRTSILILSGFLIGTACGSAAAAVERAAVLAAGMGGLAAYGAMEWIGRRRRENSLRAFELAERRLHRRLRRHIPREAVIGPVRTRPTAPSRSEADCGQFLPVVTSNRRPRRERTRTGR